MKLDPRETALRLSMLEMVAAKLIVRSFHNDARQILDWTEQASDDARTIAGKRNDPALVELYSRVWDALLASVRAELAARPPAPDGQ